MKVSESKWPRNGSEDEGDFRLCRNLRLFVPAKGVETATGVDPEFLQNSLSADERNHAFAAALEYHWRVLPSRELHYSPDLGQHEVHDLLPSRSLRRP